ncbi:hypothetical protein FHS29_005594 [Saccharothrix tamanrassetensis]|uniref:Uncharacterized protein n=1 Tax=Saccharothrix tamanrassetensis TaxID=1051531 RepID=A0A841CSN9_9PSEU|nr:hypothetical protein [Saccharothrix tamanrassetensis]MBB5958985.1 hypothetical protein [Saccharothrix tamanrassetensis]
MALSWRLQNAAEAALGTVMNEVGAHCRPMNWSVDQWHGSDSRIHLSGFPGGDYDDEEGLTVAAEWVSALGLTARSDLSGFGVVRYSGVVGDDVVVMVWAVADREVFEGRRAAGVRCQQAG